MANYMRLSGDALVKARDEAVALFIKEFDKAVQTGAKLKFEKELTRADEKACVYFTELAWIKMQALVCEYTSEIGWHGIAQRLDGEGNNYLVSDILIYPQVVTSVTVTPDQAAYDGWLMSQPDEVFNNIRFQGHSHVNMDVGPSNVDTAFYDSIVEQLGPNDFYIFMVVNKSGKKHVRIYDMQKNLYFQTADTTVKIRNDGVGIEDLLADAERKVTARVPVTTVPAASKPSSQYGGSDIYTATGAAAGAQTAPRSQKQQEVKPFGKSGKYTSDYGYDYYHGGAYDMYDE